MTLHTLLKKIYKHSAHFHTKKITALLSVFVAVSFIAGTAIFIPQKPALSAELRFSEFSKNQTIKGSVIPASCESYPTVGAHHSGWNVVDGGHCSCPTNTRLTNVDFYLCNDGGTYFDSTSGAQLPNPGVWSRGSCTAPNSVNMAPGNSLIYPLCQWAYNPSCPAYYIDQPCPAPTVNIQFN